MPQENVVTDPCDLTQLFGPGWLNRDRVIELSSTRETKAPAFNKVRREASQMVMRVVFRDDLGASIASIAELACVAPIAALIHYIADRIGKLVTSRAV